MRAIRGQLKHYNSTHLVPRVRPTCGADQNGDNLGVWKQGVGSQRNQLPVKVRGTLFEQVSRRLTRIVDGRGEKVHVPIQSLVVVVAVEELHLLERLRTGKVGLDGGVHRKKRIQCRRARLLWANHEELWQLVTRLVDRPDCEMALVEAGVLEELQNWTEFEKRAELVSQKQENVIIKLEIRPA